MKDCWFWRLAASWQHEIHSRLMCGPEYMRESWTSLSFLFRRVVEMPHATLWSFAPLALPFGLLSNSTKNTEIEINIPVVINKKAVASWEMLSGWLNFTFWRGIGFGAFNSSSLSFISIPVSWSHIMAGLKISCKIKFPHKDVKKHQENAIIM